MEFKKGIFQTWKVVENDCAHGKSWNSTIRSWDFFNILGVSTVKVKEYSWQSIFVNII